MEDIIFSIPRRIKGISKLKDCPFNIVLMKLSTYNAMPAIYVFEYRPDIANCIYGDTLTLIYYNIHDKDHYLIYTYDNLLKRYSVSKYHNDELIGLAEGGDDWNRFFEQVSLLEPVIGEKCFIRSMKMKGA